MVLAAVHATGALGQGRGHLGIAGMYGPLRLQAQHSRSKICNTAALSSKFGFERLAPRLVTALHGVAQPSLASLASSFGKSVSVKSKRYPPTGRANLGLKECSSFPLLITSCRHRIFGSGRTIRASSSLSSIERCNCGQWSYLSAITAVHNDFAQRLHRFSSD